MKGPYTSPRPLGRSLFYLYEGPTDLKSLLVCRSLETCLEGSTKSLLERNLFYLYEGPKDLQKPLRKEFVLPIWRAQRPPGIKTSSPKTSVYSEIDGFNACVRFPPIWWPEILKIQGSPKQALPQGAFTLKLTILVLLCGSPHLVARNPQNPGVPKTGSPKRNVYSEIDDFGAFVWFPPFGGQKSSKSWSCKDVDDIHLPGPQFLSNTWWLQLGLLRWKTIVNTACDARHFQHAEQKKWWGHCLRSRICWARKTKKNVHLQVFLERCSPSLQNPWKEFVLPLWRVVELSSSSKPLKRNLFYLYEGS